MYEDLYKATRETYNRVAHDFAHTRLGKKLWEFELHEFLGNDDVKNTSILDAGCGAGRVLHYLEEHNQLPGEYVGVDYSSELLVEARKWNTTDYQFLEEDLLDLNKIGQFDYIICIAVLHHFLSSYDRTKVFENMLKNLKSNGKLFITTWNVDAKNMPKKAVEIDNNIYKIPYQGGDRYYAMIYKEEIQELCDLFQCSIMDEFGSNGKDRVAGDEAMNWCYIISKQAHEISTE